MEWLTRISIVLTLLIGGGLSLYLGGCTTVKDAVATVIGAPTSSDYALAQHRVVQAETREQEARSAIEQLRAGLQQLRGSAERLDERRRQLQQMYAEAAQRMGGLEGAAADALLDMLDRLHGRLEAIASQRDEALASAADYEQRLAGQLAEVEAAQRQLQQAEVALVGLDEQAAGAVAGLQGAVGLVGQTAQAIGAPGAAAATNMVGELAAGVVGLLGVGGAAGAGWLKRRERLRAESEQQQRQRWERVILATERHGLITDDEPKKDAARRELGDDDVVALNQLTAGARKRGA